MGCKTRRLCMRRGSRQAIPTCVRVVEVYFQGGGGARC